MAMQGPADQLMPAQLLFQHRRSHYDCGPTVSALTAN
jgi:hypothetical protein